MLFNTARLQSAAARMQTGQQRTERNHPKLPHDSTTTPSLLLQCSQLLGHCLDARLYCIPVGSCQPGTISGCELVGVPAHELLAQGQLDVGRTLGTCSTQAQQLVADNALVRVRRVITQLRCLPPSTSVCSCLASSCNG